MRPTSRLRAALLCAASCIFVAHTAAAQRSGPPTTGTWTWPLYDGTTGTKGKPRPAVYTTHEYQYFGGQIDPHPGIDVMGNPNDVAVFPHGGTIVFVSNPTHCADSANYCRLWVDTDHYLFYVGHVHNHIRLATDPDYDTVRTAIDLARDKWATTPQTSAANAVQALQQLAVPVTPGMIAGLIVDWNRGVSAGKEIWFHHVHLGIFDKEDRFASLNPLSFLAPTAQGDEGDALRIVDDENPTINGDLILTPDNSVVPGSTVEDNPTLCGYQAQGAIDIDVNATDTFYTTLPKPDDFEAQVQGRHNTIDIYGAGYSVTPVGTSTAAPMKQWYESPRGCQGTQCGLWRLRQNPSLMLNTLPDWFKDRGWTDPPVLVGYDVRNQLWSTASTMDHDLDPATPVQFHHLITNGMTEDSTSTDNDAWRTEGLDGRYVVTATVWDQAGNRASKSRYVFVNGQNHQSPLPAGTAGFTSVYIQDHPGDLGQIPSNQGGEPFWASEDILVLEAPLADASGCPGAQARGAPLVVGKDYYVYVRVRNNGCTSADVNGVLVYSAVPSTPLSGIKPLRDSYADSKTIQRDGIECIGPFTWSVTKDDLDGQEWGHRCLVASVDAVGDPGPLASTVASWIPQDNDNVAQRNVQFEELTFVINNDKSATQSSNIEIDLPDGYPLDKPETYFDLYVEDTDGLAGVWQGQDPSVHSVTEDGRTYAVVRAKYGKTTMSGWNMAGPGQRWAKAKFGLPEDTGPFTITVRHFLGGVERGGMIFKVSGPSSIIIK
jgi:hypothetical protein